MGNDLFSPFLSTKKTLQSRPSSTVKASTGYHWLIEVTVHYLLVEVSCLCRYMKVAIYLHMVEHLNVTKNAIGCSESVCSVQSLGQSSNEDMLHQGQKETQKVKNGDLFTDFP